MAFNAGDVEASLTLDRSPFERGLRLARKEAEAFERDSVSLKIDVDSSALGGLDRQIGKAGRGGIRIPVGVDPASIRNIESDVEDIARNTERTASRTGNRLGRLLLNPLVIELGLLPGIAAASAAGAGAALGAISLGFAGIGAAAAFQSEELKATWGGMWSGIKAEAEQAAAPLAGVFEGMAGDISTSWSGLRPVIEQTFADSVPLVQSFSDGVIGMAEEAIPRFQQAISLSGPVMRGFESMMVDIGAGAGEFAINLSTAAVDTGRGYEILGGIIRDTAGDLGLLLAQFSGFWATIGPQFSQTMDLLTDALVTFTEGGLRGSAQGMSIFLGIVNSMLSTLGPFADILGQIGGYALAAIATWKLLAGAVGLVGRAWSLLAPGAVMGRLEGMTGAIDRMAAASGGFVEKVTRSEAAGNRFSSAVSKIGNAATKAASAIPLIGVAVAGIAAAVDHFFPSADTLAQKIMQGGAAAEEARTKMYGLEEGYSRANPLAAMFAESQSEVADAIEKARSKMTDLERAQSDLAQSQNNYQLMVDKHGESSEQASYAAQQLAFATDQVQIAQEKAANATKSHSDRIIEQTNLMLGAVGAQLNYQNSLLQLEQAEIQLRDAVKAHGAGSLEARQADIAYQQQLVATIESIGARVLAENEGQGAAKASELATAAMRTEIARLAVAAGTNLPPALAQMAAKLTDAELKALGVTRSVDGTGRAIYRLPPGKTLKFPNNAPAATGAVEGLRRAINNLPTEKWFTQYVQTVTSGPAPAPSGIPGMIGTPPGRAEGGPVAAGQVYWVGEKGLPELFFPKVDGFILNGQDSAKVMDSMGSHDTSSPRLQLDTRGGGDGPSLDPGMIAEAFEIALSRWSANAKLRFDKAGLAEVVSETTARNDRR